MNIKPEMAAQGRSTPVASLAVELVDRQRPFDLAVAPEDAPVRGRQIVRLNVGRSLSIAERQQKLNKHLHDLMRIGDLYHATGISRSNPDWPTSGDIPPLCVSNMATGNTLLAVYRSRIGEPTTDDEAYGYWQNVIEHRTRNRRPASVVFDSVAEHAPTVRLSPRCDWSHLAVCGTDNQTAADTTWAILATSGSGRTGRDGVVQRSTPRTDRPGYELAVKLIPASIRVLIFRSSRRCFAGATLRTINRQTAQAATGLPSKAHRRPTGRPGKRHSSPRPPTERPASATGGRALATSEAAREELATVTEASEAELAAAHATIAAAMDSKATFELYEDAGGKYRWRLRYRNANVIADSAQGYSSRQKAMQGLRSVQSNAAGGAVVFFEDATEDDTAEDVPVVPAPESDATFELFEDSAGEFRWRLRHDNGNILADSGEGYASKSNVRRALQSVRAHVPGAAYLRVDTVAYEVCADAAGEFRWRLLHRNGNILADSGEGCSSRSNARRAARRVSELAPDSAVDDRFEVYEDAAEEWRWRLRADNGELIADSGEGYASGRRRWTPSSGSSPTPPTPTCWLSGARRSKCTRTKGRSGAGGSDTATAKSSLTPARGTPNATKPWPPSSGSSREPAVTGGVTVS